MALTFNSTMAQWWQWATGLGGANMETPTSMAVDPYGHMAIAGQFMGTAGADGNVFVTGNFTLP